MSPSKTFNIAGLDCAYAIVQNAELREKIKTAQRGVVAGVNLFGYSAALAAYQHGQDWLAQLLKYLEENRNLVQDFVMKNFADVQISPAEATYLAWLDFGSVNLPEGPYRFFLDRAKVALNDGITFGPGGEGFVRLNFGCPQMMLLEGLQRMKTAWERAGYA
jgi:cystathionine beta-lyase